MTKKNSKVYWVKMISSLSGPGADFRAGQEYALDRIQAARLIAKNIAKTAEKQAGEKLLLEEYFVACQLRRDQAANDSDIGRAKGFRSKADFLRSEAEALDAQANKIDPLQDTVDVAGSGIEDEGVSL